MRRHTALLLLAGAFAALVITSAGTAAAPQRLQATFVDIYSQCPTSPPTLVFCGDGTIAGYGDAYSTASLTAPPTPIPGTDCLEIHAVRTITLSDGSGGLLLAETGTLCPPSLDAVSAAGGPFTVAKSYTIAGGTGVFAGATGTGSDVNRSAGNSQVSVISGTL